MPNTMDQATLPMRVRPQPTGDSSGCPPSLSFQELSLIADEEEEEEVEDNQHDIDSSPKINPPPEGTDDKQPLLLN